MLPLASAIVLDHHLLASITLFGMALDGLGSLYLAYDLLGGNNGPLRVLARSVTYGLIFTLVYTILLGFRFGLVTGIGLGLALGIEFSLAANISEKPDWLPVHPFVLGLALFRGAVLGLAAGLDYGIVFGVVFGVLTGLGLVIVYIMGFSPSSEHVVAQKPALRLKPVLGSIARGISTGTAGAIAGLIAHSTTLVVGLEVGIAAGIVGTLVSIPSPYIEWWVDNLPARRLGTVGTVLLLIGLVVQSLQYWVSLLNIPIK
jgi:hypothetical protein